MLGCSGGWLGCYCGCYGVTRWLVVVTDGYYGVCSILLA